MDSVSGVGVSVRGVCCSMGVSVRVGVSVYICVYVRWVCVYVQCVYVLLCFGSMTELVNVYVWVYVCACISGCECVCMSVSVFWDVSVYVSVWVERGCQYVFQYFSSSQCLCVTDHVSVCMSVGMSVIRIDV